ncbi:MAG: hypothetical protein IIB77_04145 [Proteobacteria bacterium]|nr:hypothetical protein [Pseudomonadota bacterium]
MDARSSTAVDPTALRGRGLDLDRRALEQNSHRPLEGKDRFGDRLALLLVFGSTLLSQ